MRRPSIDDLEQLARSQGDQPLSYPEVGATAHDELPGGYRHHRCTRPAGSGAAAFATAREAINGWAGHRRAGALVHPTNPDLGQGTTVALALRAAGVWVIAACRIVWVVDEPATYGFAYGTLPHHPETGEESFVVRLSDDERVVVEIAAFSRPASTLTRLAGPIARTIQDRTTDLYLDGLTTS